MWIVLQVFVEYLYVSGRKSRMIAWNASLKTLLDVVLIVKDWDEMCFRIQSAFLQ